jgi:hypothetical protein
MVMIFSCASSFRQAQGDREGLRQAAQRLFVEMADTLPQPRVVRSLELFDHDFGWKTQSVLKGRLHRHTKYGWVRREAGNGTQKNGPEGGSQNVGLHDDGGSRLTGIARQRDRHDVAAPHI